MTQFKFEQKENDIYITGLEDGEDKTERIYIPETIEGHRVTGIGEHAFYQNHDIKEVILPDSVKVIEKYAFAECRQLVRIRMSEMIEGISDYAFYNCHALEDIDLYANLKTMGYGAFKNCSELKHLRLYTDGIKPLEIGALIDDNSHEIHVDLYNEHKELLTKLVFTEFDYDCILQVEARQFDWVYHGSGNVYRQCITTKGVDFEKYDSLFASAVREDWPQTAMAIALGRVLYPYKLEAAHEKTYIEFLKEHRQEVFELFLKNQDVAQFEKLLDVLADQDCLRQWIEAAGKLHRYEFVSLLMDYQQKHYGRQQKTFEL